MVQESTTEVSPSISTGTFSDLCGAIASFSVKHHGIVCADSPLCASAIRVRQQNGLNGRASSVPTSSNSFNAIPPLAQTSGRHCEERKRRSNPFLALFPHGLLRFARNDERWIASLHHRGGLPEQDLALFLGADRGLAEIRIDLLGERIGALRGRPLADGLEPALEMR